MSCTRPGLSARKAAEAPKPHYWLVLRALLTNFSFVVIILVIIRLFLGFNILVFRFNWL